MVIFQAFRKGSPLVPELSRAIAKMREDGRLAKIENERFTTQSPFTTSDRSILASDDTSSNVKPLTLDSFRGLFLITGVSSAFALAMLYSFLPYRNWHHLRNCNLCELIQNQIKFVKESAFTKAPRKRQANVTPAV